MYQALYRKYRPIDFDSVVGQNAVVKTLKNAIIHKNFSHAYLFFGPRGIGKTTISKIFARGINCMNPKDGNACGKCDACKISFSKNCMDILEIDAASNNGVDEIRDLKSKISLVPTDLNYKIYIIDEVHMLSIGAFNALLKTLEDPPEHAIFILATTDPQKIPETIVSRCQTFSFKRISPDVVHNRLSFVCKNEKIKIDDEVLENISLLVDGGMRDALSLLDKLVSYTNDKITMNDFVEINGIISNNQLNDFLFNIFSCNISNVLTSLNEFDNCGKNLVQVFTQILNYSRNLIVDYYVKDNSIPFSIDILQLFANFLNEKMFDIKKAGNTRIFVEIFLLKFMNDFVAKTNEKIEDKTKAATENTDKKVIVEKENEVESFFTEDIDIVDENEKNISLIDNENPKILNISEIMNVRINNTLASADKTLLKDEQELFKKLSDYTFDQQIGYIVCALLDAKVRAVSPENMIISFENDANVQQNLYILEKIEDVYQKITNSSKKIAIISDSSWDNIKNEYIENKKKGIPYEILDEPKAVLEEVVKDDIITGSAIELFGDIVEIE